MTQISRGRKTVLAKYGTKAYRTIGAGVAYEVNRILSDNATMGTGTRARTSDGRPQAGKTGPPTARSTRGTAATRRSSRRASGSATRT
jgi:membrane carboxypeptidase/penicillin-binding protein